MPPSCRCPAEQAGGDATSPGGLPTPGLQQRHIFFPAGGGFPHITPWLLQASQPAGALCQYGTATQGRLTWANASKHGRAYHQRALDFQGGYHHGEGKDVPRDTTASTHILETHPAAGHVHTLAAVVSCGAGTAGATAMGTDLRPGLPHTVQLGNVAASCLRGVVVTD